MDGKKNVNWTLEKILRFSAPLLLLRTAPHPLRFPPLPSPPFPTFPLPLPSPPSPSHHSALPSLLFPPFPFSARNGGPHTRQSANPNRLCKQNVATLSTQLESVEWARRGEEGVAAGERTRTPSERPALFAEGKGGTLKPRQVSGVMATASSSPRKRAACVWSPARANSAKRAPRRWLPEDPKVAESVREDRVAAFVSGKVTGALLEGSVGHPRRALFAWYSFFGKYGTLLSRE